MARSRDARLVARLRRGDDAAFDALHARHQPAVLSFCTQLTGSREDAEDAVQHTFLACYRWLGRENAEPVDRLEPWLFTVARNRCLSLLRARRDEAAADDDLGDRALDGLTVEVERRQELRDLVRDVAGLPEPQRAALVLSQLDALSYREIGTVLDVPAEKVKAFVYQARSALASAREAREAPCFEVREELATARGAARRRRLLRRHVGQCEGCREFEVAVMRQRHDLGLLLPVAPSAGLGEAIFDAIGRETATAGGTGAATTGGGVGATVGGTLTVVGLPGIAKLAVVAAVVGGGTGGALAADLPARVADAAPWRGADDGVAVGERHISPAGSNEVVRGRGTPDPGPTGPGRDGRAGSDVGDEPSGVGERALALGEGAPAPGGGQGSPGASPSQSGAEDGPSLPPGVAKRDELPPGLAKRDGDLPPGLAKREGAPQPTPGNGAGGPGNGNGNGGDVGQNNGNAGGQGQGQGQGQGNGGAQGGGQSNGGGNGGGQGQGNSNTGGQGQGQGQGSGKPR